MQRKSLCPLCCLLVLLSGLAAHGAKAQSISSKMLGRALKAQSGSSEGFTFSYPLGERQALYVGAEMVRYTSYPAPMKQYNQHQPYWKFRGVPITFGYTRTLRDAEAALVPAVSVGASYYLCRTASRHLVAAAQPAAPREDLLLDDLLFDKDQDAGAGYGAEAALSLRANVVDQFFLLGQARYRYVNGFAFTDEDADGARFPLLDFSVGIGFNLPQ